MTRTRGRGFTLVELTVALAAGLIVALGIVGLSKEATRTFHEEARSSAAEATLRTAVDRLRADLARAAYMSTPNIMSDLKIARAPSVATNISNIPGNFLGLRRLAGIHLFDGGSAAATPLSASQVPALAPAAIEIGGNMTSAEQFEIENVQQVGNCDRLVFSANSGAVYRVAAVGAAAPAELSNIFQPYTKHQFIVRVVDDAGHSQFVATCPEDSAAGFINGTQPYVDIDRTNTPVMMASDTSTVASLTRMPSGKAFVNPVQIVRWEIVAANSEPKQYQNALGGQSLAAGVDPNKYDLVREFVDALGAVVPETIEVVAEYAVDLDFAFSVENGTDIQPATLTLAFDDPANQTWADDVSATNVAVNRPQRIRIVRARVVTRTAQPDRTAKVAPLDLYKGPAAGFLFRYCMVPPNPGAPCPDPPDSVYRWARARTLTTEVRLMNQAGYFAP
ncbi:MAG: prepilin-type N-terminal cleavage/methylation domain-containing protein [Myxococcales bacterium]|nr:prepilin-type N-terminal cleavage/methylation domain-containing protein [Myxococcales bacterium]